MKRVIAISLLLIFIAGQVNLTWASHFCGVFKVKSQVMLGHGHLDCGMVEMTACDKQDLQTHSVMIETNGCCENIYFSSDSDDNFSAAETINIQGCDFILNTLFSFSNLTIDNSTTGFSINPSPPLILTDKCLMYQTFII